MSRLSEAIARNRREVLNAERRGANRMVQAYGETYTRLSRQLDSLIERIEDLRSAGKTVSQNMLFREVRFRLLLEQVQEELDRFAPAASATVVEAQRAAVGLAGSHSQELIRTAAGPLPEGRFVPESFTRFSPETVRELVGRTAAGSPVRELFEQFGKDASIRARAILVETVTAGQPLNVAAKALREELQIPLARALTISRTEVIGAYREASIRTYEENKEIVPGWRWTAALNQRTCAMCLAMDGRVFPNSVPFGSHPNCRCTPVPETKPWSELGPEFADIPDNRVKLQKGSEWFAKQPDRIKRKILSPRKYELYKSGDLTLDDLIAYRVDKAYGPNRWERSLKHIESGKYASPKRALGR
jgi:SPP1 gp7 family putative phage head morphogenesis protein